MFRSFIAALSALAVSLAPAASLAGPGNAVLNKAGYWALDADGDSCAASLKLAGGDLFVLRGHAGQVTFALFAAKSLKRGKAGKLSTEAYSFDFEPSYTENSTTLYFNGELNSRAVAALRLAREVRVVTDDREVAAMVFEDTGFEEVLDGLIACSKGEEGWWGAGVGGQKVAATPAPEPAMNKEGIWSLAADGDSCASAARVGEGAIVLVATNGGGDVVMGFSAEGRLKRGRKGVFETDAYSFAFKPSYEGDDYMQLDKFFDSQALFALRRAKLIRVTVDGREVASAELADTGLDDLLTSLAACGAGETGWWGEGAKR